MCAYTVLNKNKNTWIMHQDIPSQQSTALVSNITCHLQISPCWLFWGFVFRAKLLHHDNQTHPAVVCKNSALFQLGKIALNWVFPPHCASWHAVHFYSPEGLPMVQRNLPGTHVPWRAVHYPLLNEETRREVLSGERIKRVIFCKNSDSSL